LQQRLVDGHRRTKPNARRAEHGHDLNNDRRRLRFAPLELGSVGWRDGWHRAGWQRDG
jgi:hypothetical protein